VLGVTVCCEPQHIRMLIMFAAVDLLPEKPGAFFGSVWAGSVQPQYTQLLASAYLQRACHLY
jgi:hypothetical protein